MILRRALIAIVALLVCVARAEAQTSPNLTYSQVPSADQWNGYFSGKQDYVGTSGTGPILRQTSPTINSPTITGTIGGTFGGAFTGGTVDGSPIGATTPSTGKFTNLGATGTSTLSGPIASQIGASILASGALCNNTTDDAAILNPWLAALPRGTTVVVPPGAMCLIGSSNLNVPNLIKIVGSGDALVMIGGSTNPTPASGFYVTSPNQIVMGYGTTLDNLDIMASGLTAHPTSAQMTAMVNTWAAQSNAGVLVPQNNGGATLRHLFVAGFNTCVRTMSGQFTLRELYVDCVNGIVESDAGDVNTTDDIHAEPWLCINTSGCDLSAGGWGRPGAGLYFLGNASNVNVHHAFQFGYYTGIVIDNLAGSTLEDLGSEWNTSQGYGTIYTGYGSTAYRFINFSGYGIAHNIFANGQAIPYDIEGYAGIDTARYSPPSLAGAYGVAEFYLKSNDAATIASVTLSGTPAAGNTVSVTVTSANLTVSPRVVTHIVLAGENLSRIVEDLNIRLNTDAILSGAHFYALMQSNTVLYVGWPNGATATVTASSTGGVTTAIGAPGGQGGAIAVIRNVLTANADTSHPMLDPAGQTGAVEISGMAPFTGWIAPTDVKNGTWR